MLDKPTLKKTVYKQQTIFFKDVNVTKERKAEDLLQIEGD